MEAACILFLSLLCPQSKDPEEVLTVYLSDLEKAVKNTSAKNLPDRTRLEQAAKAAFDRELASSAPAVPKAAWDYLSKHLDNLRLGDKKFPEDPWKSERGAWINACRAVFNRELKGAREPETPPSTDQLFDSTLDAVREADRMFPLAQDLRADAVTSIKTIFTQTLPKSTPASKDPKLVFTERLARIDKVFPVSGDKEKSLNYDSSLLLKTLAKALFDRELAGAKK